MSKIDSWVTKVPRLKNSKVARFSYKAEAYANDNIEGVDSYDYSRDMNVPLATNTDFDASVLSSGARTSFSSVPKNGLNHFFGRVSYNLNKVIDFLSDFLDDFRVQGVETIRRAANFTLGAYTDGKKIRIANTHATNTITCTLPSGQTMNGAGTISIPAGRIIDIELIGSTWKDNLTGNLVGNVTGNVTGNLTGNSSTATAPLYQWRKTDLYRNAAGESPAITYYWFRVCNITTAMTFDVELFSDANYSYRASYRLSVTKYTSGSVITYTVALFNLGQTVAAEAKLAVAIDAGGYLYIQTNCLWTSYFLVTLLYSISSNFSVTMDKLGYAPFGTGSGFTPVKIITQTGGFRLVDGVVTETDVSPIINTNIIGNVTGNVTGNLTGNVTGNLTGNADTATKLATPRTINGVSFDGSTDITIADSNLSDSFVGMIAAFSDTADFSNWLFCDGRAVSRTSYAKLFARIGITWGAGNTTTTFNLPDLREVTLVGAGDSPRTMTDPDVFTVAQFKNATFKAHTHTFNRGKYTLTNVYVDSEYRLVLPDGFEEKSTDSTGSTVTRANSMGVGYFIRSS